jgi:hypothetical protein
MNIQFLVDISRLFIPVIAFIGMYIAWQQFTANREKFRFELYDKRFNIYITVFQFTDKLLWDGGELLEKEYAGFDASCIEAEFLLPERICIEIRALKLAVRSWRNIKRRAERDRDEAKHLLAKEELVALESKIEGLADGLLDVFKGVLKFEKF